MGAAMNVLFKMVWVPLCFSAIAPGPPTSRSDNEFVTRAVKRWSELFPARDSLKVTVSMEKFDESGEKVAQFETTFRCSGKMASEEETIIPSDQGIRTTSCYVYNEQYEFELSRKNDSEWVIVNVNQVEQNQRPITRLARNSKLWRSGGVMLPYLIPIQVLDFGSRNCNILKVSPETSNPNPLWQVDFEMNYGGYLSGGGEIVGKAERGEAFLVQHFQKGTIWFDEAMGLLPVRGSLSEKNGHLWDMQWSYQVQNGRTVPETATFSYSGEGKLVYRFAFDFTPVSPEAFFLPFYGLPELPIADWQLGRYGWILAVVIAIILIVAGVFWSAPSRSVDGCKP